MTRSAPGERVHYADWLRAIIVYGIALFHVALVFSIGGWLVSNKQQSMVISAFAGFTFIWGIPALFMIAGAASWFTLRRTAPRPFVSSRFRHLMIPFLVGLAVLTPYQLFVISHNPPPAWDRLPAAFVSFFQHLTPSNALTVMKNDSFHLWFLSYLFALVVAWLPLLRWFASDTGEAFVGWLIRLSRRPLGLMALCLPLCLSQLVLRPFFPAYEQWADVATYSFAYICGAAIIPRPEFSAGLRHGFRLALASGIVCLLVIGAFARAGGHPSDSLAGGVLLDGIYDLAWAIATWSWMIVVLNVGIRWLNRPVAAVRSASNSAMTFYVIHHPVVLTLASFIVTWHMGLWPKFLILLVLVYAITAVLTVGLHFGWRGIRHLRPTHSPRSSPTTTIHRPRTHHPAVS